jgi:hypothetical protein
MKTDKTLEQILAALQQSQPALKEEAAAKLTNSILADIANKKQLTHAGGRLLYITKGLMAAASVLLLFILLYEEVDLPGNRQTDIMYNSYYKETISGYDSLPPTKSINLLLDYCKQNKKEESALTLLREQYHPIAKK